MKNKNLLPQCFPAAWMDTAYFTLIEFLMRKIYKKGASFRWSRSVPCLASSFFIRVFHCFPVQAFKCFSVPSSFRIPCPISLLRRIKIKFFTMIELLIVIAIISIR
ncbi:MAG TPA: hypothetical protein DE060_12630 [Lentisphaeria bacterium]|nr:hypothetical protein [Lentisphaeria bacterium]HCG50035.1 hypothetical protein [Lentisphaeria bacterium]